MRDATDSLHRRMRAGPGGLRQGAARGKGRYDDANRDLVPSPGNVFGTCGRLGRRPYDSFRTGPSAGTSRLATPSEASVARGNGLAPLENRQFVNLPMPGLLAQGPMAPVENQEVIEFPEGPWRWSRSKTPKSLSPTNRFTRPSHSYGAPRSFGCLRFKPASITKTMTGHCKIAMAQSPWPAARPSKADWGCTRCGGVHGDSRAVGQVRLGGRGFPAATSQANR